MATYRFSWACGFMGESDYRVAGHPTITALRVRHTADDYFRSVYNGTQESWERDVIGAINLLVSERSSEPVPQDMVDEFNAWRESEYQSHRTSIDAQPERYGVIDWNNDPVFKRPIPVRGARYVVTWNRPGPDQWKYGCIGHGWQINGEADILAQPATV